MTINLVRFIDKSIVPKKGIKLFEEYLKSKEDERKVFEKIMSHPDKKVNKESLKVF